MLRVTSRHLRGVSSIISSTSLRSKLPLRSQFCTSIQSSKFYSKIFEKDKRYNDVFLEKLHKHGTTPQVFAFYNEKLENFINTQQQQSTPLKPAQNKPIYSLFRKPLLYGIIIIGAIYFYYFRRGVGRSSFFRSPVHTEVKSSLILPDTRFADVKGIDAIKEELQTIVRFLENPQAYKNMGAKIPKGVLLYGPPGTGKTMIARAIAGEASVPIFHCNAASFDEVFVGVGSGRIRSLFADAKKNSPCIIFMDEIDALGEKRSQFKTGQHQTLNQLLSELDGFESTKGIVFICATNRSDVLDPALLRPGRIDQKIQVPLPDLSGRKEIFDFYLSRVKKKETINSEALAASSIGLTGADIASIVNRAAILAVERNVSGVTESLIQESFTDQTLGNKQSLVLSEEDKKLVAYHESGHAVVAYFSPQSATRIRQATILPRGPSLGCVQLMPTREHLYSKSANIASLDVALGGRISEELQFGKDNVTTGAASDFYNVLNLANQMVLMYGMSDLGIIGYDKKDLSPDQQALVDREVQKIIAEREQVVKNLLIKKRGAVQALVNRLLEKETISGEEVESLLALYK